MKKLYLIVFLVLLFTSSSKAQVWGEYDSRTESRDNAGLQGNAGAKSGFYHTVSPVNYPAGAQDWWHLLDIRHSNPANNYAMQFSGSFFDQNLYFRKTNNNASQAWSKIPLEDNLTVSFGTINNNYTPTTGNWTGDGSTLRLNALDYSTISFHDSGNRADFIRAGAGTIQLGYDGGWGQANIGMPGGLWSSAGNLGIGTTDTRGYKLAVNGTIRSKEVKVEAGPWPDYVFKPSYRLPALNEVKAYVEKNRHLPEMPSERQVAKEGINLGEMNRLLVKKVEELTLYLIEKDRELKTQMKINQDQEQRLKKIEQKLH